ncbi:hypothetical protein HMPREF3039_00840 [Akkermansia sp. KLE1798]|nr:hypothetical protein HMPREF3039_00840 [Akkermansia sp. KLE1798]KZA04411.1 hypothetical protein HMPREF1326_01921 [Akkermansia sp. KLE1605]
MLSLHSIFLNNSHRKYFRINYICNFFENAFIQNESSRRIAPRD